MFSAENYESQLKLSKEERLGTMLWSSNEVGLPIWSSNEPCYEVDFDRNTWKLFFYYIFCHKHDIFKPQKHDTVLKETVFNLS
jgi:hypothetical protein